MNLLSFSLVYLIPISVFLGYWMGGVYTFLTPFFIFIVVPLTDMIIGTDTRNPGPDEQADLDRQKAYRWLTWGCMPLQLAVVGAGAYIIGRGGLSLLEFAGLTVSVGMSSGILGINVAHELTHRVNEKFEPYLSRIMLCTVFYNHWGQEHVVGHHRWVATPHDPATARLGESFYRFWPRTVLAGLRVPGNSRKTG